MIQLRSDQDPAPHHQAQAPPSWSHSMERTKEHLNLYLLILFLIYFLAKSCYWNELHNQTLLNVNFSWAHLKKFEVLFPDNINILYNFTRQKERGLKSELGSPIVDNLYRVVSGKIRLDPMKKS